MLSKLTLEKSSFNLAIGLISVLLCNNFLFLHPKIPVQFEGIHTPERLCRIWQNYEHPHINKEVWSEEEIEKLKQIAKDHNFVDWQAIAQELGVSAQQLKTKIKLPLRLLVECFLCTDKLNKLHSIFLKCRQIKVKLSAILNLLKVKVLPKKLTLQDGYYYPY